MVAMETSHFLKMLNDASLASLGFLIWRVHRCILCKNILWVLQCKVGPKCTFLDLWPWKLLSRSNISKVTIWKGSSGWKTEKFELSHAQIGHLVWAVGVSKKKKKKKKACISSFNVKSYFVPTVFRYRGILINRMRFCNLKKMYLQFQC
jgi:hypothetical protein